MEREKQIALSYKAFRGNPHSKSFRNDREKEEFVQKKVEDFDEHSVAISSEWTYIVDDLQKSLNAILKLLE